MPSPSRPQLPPRLLPILYLGAAHLALAVAFAAVALEPRRATGFFYHPWMLGIVHLVTLGWITASILGSLYLVGPIALRVRLPATWVDYTAFALVSVGIAGMVGHFWIGNDAGMAWAAAMVGTGLVIAAGAIVPRVVRAPLPRAITAHIVLAFLNVLGAATMGVLVGFDKVYHFLPGFVLANVFAHAHLAAIGWASMMVVGIAYRMLPMVLPAQMPEGRRLWTSAVLLEAGVVMLFVALVRREPFAWAGAVLVTGGFGAFLAHAAWMLRHPRPRPPGLPMPDPAVLHAAAAFASLAIACALGVWLSLASPSPAALRVASAYGVFGLVGFLAQIVIGMEGRLLPLFAWYWAYANTDYRKAPPSPHAMAWRRGQHLGFALWLVGVPALAGGFAFERVTVVGVAGWCLLAAALLDAWIVAGILRHAYVTAPQFRRPIGSSSAAS
ncbi:MAG: hypothetical protein ACM3SQ_15940 [Betaproteobacteria bacterium]